MVAKDATKDSMQRGCEFPSPVLFSQTVFPLRNLHLAEDRMWVIGHHCKPIGRATTSFRTNQTDPLPMHI